MEEPNNTNWEILKEIIVGLEREEIKKLKQRLDDPENFANELSEVINEALRIKSEKDEELSDTLYPTIEKSIFKSIQKDPQPLADAMFPIMGPAIRKSISETFRSMIQSLNETLEKSFSIQGIKWRIESIITKKPYAELVLFHSLIYQVRQVFLIHKETGLLLNQVSINESDLQDGDMVSAMLTAIKDFVKDSFKLQQGEELDTIQVGELKVWIEQGPKTIIAAVVMGDAPFKLKDILKDEILNIHKKYSEEFENFEGDTAPFEQTTQNLENCLIQKEKEKKKKPPIFSLGIFAAIAIVLGFFIFKSVQKNNRWEAFIDQLKIEPGIVLTDYEKSRKSYYLAGLKDSDARDAGEIASVYSVPFEKIKTNWKPFYSDEVEILSRRVKRIFELPEDVTFKVEDDILIFYGVVRLEWFAKHQDIKVHGIKKIDFSNLKVEEVGLLNEYEERIESEIISFKVMQYDVEKEQISPDLIHGLKEYIRIGNQTNQEFHIYIIGNADTFGGMQINQRVSFRRAESVRNYLVKNGIDENKLIAINIFNLKEDGLLEDFPEYNREVLFRILNK
jgi:hypothetical protein